MRPIISNINTASYEFTKYLAKLLSLLSTSEYTVKSTNEFITHIRGQNIPNNFKLIFFHVTSLFTKVSLDFTIIDQNEGNTNIPKERMRELRLLCTKNVLFRY